MKIHIWSIIKYFFVFILILFFIIVFKQNYLVFLLFPYILLPAGLIPLFIINVKKIKVSGGTDAAAVDKGNDIIFFLEYDNPTYLPFLKCRLTFNISNHYYGNKNINYLNFNIAPSKKDRIYINTMTSKTGMVSFNAKSLLVTGFLGMVSTYIPAEFTVSVPVFPTDSGKIVAPEMPFSEGYDEYSEPDLKGNPSSDIKEIREYRPGDRLARIHWKLSAKTDSLQVKEMERTSVMSLIILPELERNNIEQTIKTLDAVSRELIASGERFEICLFNNSVCDFEYFVIDNEEMLYECYRNMFFLPLYDNEGSAREAYYSSGQKSSIILTVHDRDIKLYEDNLLV